MKKIAICVVCVCLLITVILLVGKHVPDPETNLEFWIGDRVNDETFSQYQAKYGLMGGREYYGSGYVPVTDENGEQKDPAQCVVYTVTSYPDYASGKQHVTRIYITDPTIELYGVTLDSSLGEIDTAMRAHGFRPSNSPGVSYRKGKVTIRFSDEAIQVSVKVTNFFHIQF